MAPEYEKLVKHAEQKPTPPPCEENTGKCSTGTATNPSRGGGKKETSHSTTKTAAAPRPAKKIVNPYAKVPPATNTPLEIFSEEWDNISLGSFEMDYEKSNNGVTEENQGTNMIWSYQENIMKKHALTLFLQELSHVRTAGTWSYVANKPKKAPSRKRKSEKSKNKNKKHSHYKRWKTAAAEAMKKMAELIALGGVHGDDASDSEGSDGSENESL